MKITDKQRISYIQRHRLEVRLHWATGNWHVWQHEMGMPRSEDKIIGTGISWLQAVDKAIKAYMGGKK